MNNASLLLSAFPFVYVYASLNWSSFLFLIVWVSVDVYVTIREAVVEVRTLWEWWKMGFLKMSFGSIRYIQLQSYNNRIYRIPIQIRSDLVHWQAEVTHLRNQFVDRRTKSTLVVVDPPASICSCWLQTWFELLLRGFSLLIFFLSFLVCCFQYHFSPLTLEANASFAWIWLSCSGDS